MSVRPAITLALACALALPAFAAEGADLRVSGPYTHDRLQVFLIHHEDLLDTSSWLTLAEALEAQQAVVHETGQVSELALEVQGERPVFVHSGDVVKGGQQDRVIAYDLIARAADGRIPLASFCVEQGRWNPRGAEREDRFASAAYLATGTGLKATIRGGGARREAAAAGGFALFGSVEQETERVARVDQAVQADVGGDAPQVLVQAQLSVGSNPQSEVWEAVAAQQEALSSNFGGIAVAAESSATSLQLTLEHGEVLKRREPYRAALAGILDQHPDAVGLCYAIDGEIAYADRYPSHELFARMWDKLLASCITEALAAQPRVDGDPAREEAGQVQLESAAVQAWLRDLDARPGQTQAVHGDISQIIAADEEKARFDGVDARLEIPWFHRAYAVLEIGE